LSTAHTPPEPPLELEHGAFVPERRLDHAVLSVGFLLFVFSVGLVGYVGLVC